jgi:hypothetical protein
MSVVTVQWTPERLPLPREPRANEMPAPTYTNRKNIRPLKTEESVLLQAEGGGARCRAIIAHAAARRWRSAMAL